jgi:hypothetical protein
MVRRMIHCTRSIGLIPAVLSELAMSEIINPWSRLGARWNRQILGPVVRNDEYAPTLHRGTPLEAS